MAGDTFGKLKSSFSRSITTISIKTASSLEKMKIKTHIESICSEREKLIAAVGEAAYALWEAGCCDVSSLNEQFSVIRQKKEEIARLETEYAAIDQRDGQILGTQASKEAAAFLAAEEPMEGITCPSCGSSYVKQVRFCKVCGTRLAE